MKTIFMNKMKIKNRNSHLTAFLLECLLFHTGSIIYIENIEKEKNYKNCVHFIKNTGNDCLIIALCEAYKLKFENDIPK